MSRPSPLPPCSVTAEPARGAAPVVERRGARAGLRVVFGCVAMLLASVALSGCFLIRDTVNDSPAIRWWLFSKFGAPKVCPEMLSRGASLKLGGAIESTGRFFPTQCNVQVHDPSQTMTLSFSGSGYAWTPVAGRIGFEASVSVVYRPDFVMTEDALYVWARTQQVLRGPDFSVLSVEQPVVQWAANGPAGYLANSFGQQIVSSKLSEGFTVVRSDTGDDFSLGILQPPARPTHPFRTDGENYVAVNESIAVQSGQVDFLGPITVVDDDQFLQVTWQSQGPAADLLLFPRFTADQWRMQLERGARLAAPQGPSIGSWVINPGQQRIRIPTRPGQYVLVVDHSPHIGTQRPAWNPLAGLGQGTLRTAIVVEVAED